MNFTFSNQTNPELDVLVVGAYKGCELAEQTEALDDKTEGLLLKSLKASYFKGKQGNIVEIVPPSSIEYRRILVVGLGEKGKLSETQLQDLGGKIYAHISRTPDESVCIDLGDLAAKGLSSSDSAAHIAYGALLRSWRFDKYRTQEKDEDIPSLATGLVIVSHPKEAASKYKELHSVAEGVFLARSLVSEPPNVIYPESYANIISDLKSIGLEVEILDEKKMKKLGMNALLGVGQGSIRESQLVCIEWKGARDKHEAPLAFIGKGVCFDTGGISLKPAQGMEEMKYDMAGSAVVVGLMKTLANRKAKINAIGVVGLVENMPGGNAQRPSDIVTSMSGQTIEVLNTDAEGRLVLADALWYTQDKYKPRLMVDLATLTGAIVVALGSEYAGLFSNDEEISAQLSDCGEETGEKVWRLPLHKHYDKDIDSDVADVANIGKSRGAGSITAAQFLQRFVNDVPWAHLDIAGVAWTKKALPTCNKGATGFGIRLLDKFISKYYES